LRDISENIALNISKLEQRVLHALAQGGRIHHERDAAGRIREVYCLTREGHRLMACDLVLFSRLKRRRLIASRLGRPYGITREGLAAVRAQLNQR
jgi:uncharacterized protein YjhX (UPF0386 family)